MSKSANEIKSEKAKGEVVGCSSFLFLLLILSF